MNDKPIVITVDVDWVVGGVEIFEGMKAAGYAAHIWKAGTLRTIPHSLAQACKRSGAPLAHPEDGMPEDNYREPGPPVVVDAHAHYAEKFGQEPFVRVMLLTAGGKEQHFTDGSLSAEFGALDMEPTLHLNEILELPRSLVERCIASGAQFTNAPEEMEPFEGAYQARYQHPRQAYRESVQAKREQERQRRERERIEAEAARILAEEDAKRTAAAFEKARKRVAA